MECEERMTVTTVDICPCGKVFHQLDPDDYDTLGSDSGICCPDCGNEKFQTIKQLQVENKELNDLLKKVTEIGDISRSIRAAKVAKALKGGK